MRGEENKVLHNLNEIQGIWALDFDGDRIAIKFFFRHMRSLLPASDLILKSVRISLKTGEDSYFLTWKQEANLRNIFLLDIDFEESCYTENNDT